MVSVKRSIGVSVAGWLIVAVRSGSLFLFSGASTTERSGKNALAGAAVKRNRAATSPAMRAICTIAMVASAFHGRSKALGASKLGPAPAALLLEPPLLRCARRARGLALALDRQRPGKPTGEALERQLAVAPLRTRVLRDRPDDRPATRHHAAFLAVGEGRRRAHVEAGLDPRRGDVRVLAPRAGGPGRAHLDLVEGDRYAGADMEHVVSVPRRCGFSAASSPPGASTSATT